ncbi:OB-fold-containig protein [Streptomyces barkulensis]|uniref:OB-fold-containig protein n=1 Tax=Streptomyces barkulensis TaxID=1257026 RepID=UPI000C6C8C96|nr:OB-fold-containig protein [Streptomyces barkulensis]
MSEFMRTAMSFPANLFGFGLVVVLVYWLTVLVGAVGVDALDGGESIDAGHCDHFGTGPATGPAAVLAAAGLGGAPVSVSLSLLISIAWFASLSGAVLVERAGGGAPARLLVLPAALLAAWVLTRLLVRPLARLAPRETGTGHRDLVGRLCTIRTGHVSHRFGQAEIAADDGSVHLVQVRARGEDAAGLAAGSTALVFDYDPDGGFFHVMPCDPVLDPGPDAGRPPR